MGSIRQNNGIWYYRYYDLHRKPHEISLRTRNKVIAERMREMYNEQLSIGTDPRLINNASLSFVAENYFDYLTPQKSPSIIENGRMIFRRLSEWDNVEIHKITQFHILRLIEQLQKEYAQETVRKTIMLLKRILRWARREGFIIEDPSEGITLEKTKYSRRLKYFSKEELKTIFEIAEKKYPKYAPIFKFFYLTGLRRSELVSLQWDDVDLEQKVIRVRDSKTMHGIRRIPLRQEAITILEKIPRESKWVFTGEITGGPKRGDIISRTFTKVLVATGLKKPGISVHTLRHTFASHLAMAGVSLDIIRDLLGHSSVVITEIYAHLAPDHHKKAIEKLPEILPNVTE